MTAYALLMKDKVVPFGKLYSEWYSPLYRQPSMFFTFLLVEFRDLQMSEFAKDFMGAVVCDQCGGGQISPLSLYKDVQLNLKTWTHNACKLAALGLDKGGEIADQANRGGALLTSLRKVYGNVAQIPDTLPPIPELEPGFNAPHPIYQSGCRFP
ncbi:MAG: hypothetical protein RBR86_03560 [Pseudobdellovibrionaceae bacterium]|jgi:hypothetical protein|nr:hypothetical protein [Pseudobdellovibrionaceae bacterium]